MSRSVIHTEVIRTELVTVVAPASRIITVGQQGPPGPPGAGVLTGQLLRAFVAASPLSALRMVRVGADARIGYADPLSGPDPVGLLLQAVEEGGSGEVLMFGWVEDASWTWSPGPLFLGAEGAVTQAVPEAGTLREVGRAYTPTRILVDIQAPIAL